MSLCISGNNSISWIPDGATSTLSFECNNCFNSSFSDIRFYINGGSVGGQNVIVTLQQSGKIVYKSLVSSCLSAKTITANSWSLAQCYLSDLLHGVATPISVISFQSGDDSKQQKLFLDQIILVYSSSSSSSSSESPSTTPKRSTAAASHSSKFSPPPSRSASQSSLPSSSITRSTTRSHLISHTVSSIPTYSSPLQNIVCSTPHHWSSTSTGIQLNKNPFYIKGVSWFGFETHNVPDGLGSASTTVTQMFTFLSKHNFNSLRIPVSLEMVLSNPTDPLSLDGSSGLSKSQTSSRALDILDQIILYAQDFNILIMLDMHVLKTNGTANQLWYDQSYSEEQLTQGWVTLAQRYKNFWNVFAADLKSNIHGTASWGSNITSTDWLLASERIANAILRTDVNWLVFIQGVENATGQKNNMHFWGGNFEGVKKSSGHIVLSDESGFQERVVYSPHVFGPSVSAEIVDKNSKENNNNNNGGDGGSGNMRATWDLDFGNLQNITGRAVVIGEFGGKNATQDRNWGIEMAKYLQEKNINSIYYWSLTSDFTGRRGLLGRDYKTTDDELLNLLSKMVDTPSAVSCTRTEKSGAKPDDSSTSITITTRKKSTPPDNLWWIGLIIGGSVFTFGSISYLIITIFLRHRTRHRKFIRIANINLDAEQEFSDFRPMDL